MYLMVRVGQRMHLDVFKVLVELSLYFGGPDLHGGGGGGQEDVIAMKGAQSKVKWGGGEWVRAHDVNGGGDRVASCQ